MQEKKEVVDFLQSKIKCLELDVQYQLHQIENLEKKCQQLEEIVKNNNISY